jgi:GT2 family glycosyltransferase
MMDKINQSVCAVVVTYNRKELLLECLESLLKQSRSVQGVYVIDNFSTDGTPRTLLDAGYISELPPENMDKPWEKEFIISNLTDKSPIVIHYVRMYENIGGAGGFYEGVKRGYERGYDWLWLMDDDSEPYEDALYKASNHFDKKNVVGLANLKVNLDQKILTYHRGYFNFNNIFKRVIIPINEKNVEINKYIEIDHASFVGILVNKYAISKIGFPNKNFFIHYDDVEYCIRLRTIGKMLLICDSVICHKEAAEKGVEKIFLSKKSCRIPYENLWISYYGNRNIVWLAKKYNTNSYNYHKALIKNYIKTIIAILIFDNKKMKRIKFITNAYVDGLRGTFDNIKPKKLLY